MTWAVHRFSVLIHHHGHNYDNHQHYDQFRDANDTQTIRKWAGVDTKHLVYIYNLFMVLKRQKELRSQADMND